MTLAADIAGANHKKTAHWNRGLTLRLLRQHRMLSRKELADMTGLRGSTLTYIVRELLDEKIVQMTGKKKESKSVGKKQAMLELNPRFGWIAGFSIRPGSADAVLLDSGGQVVNRTKFDIGHKLEETPAELKHGLDQWLKTVKAPTGKLLGVGVGLPGVVDPDQGRVLRSSSFNASDIALQQLLSDTFSTPAIVDHNAAFGAGAEATQGAAQNQSHFLYFLVNHQLSPAGARLNSYGSALYLNNEVYRGAHYSAGELNAVIDPPTVNITGADFAALTNADAEMTSELLPLAQHIGRSLGTLVNFIDVPLVILAGNTGIRNRAFLKEIERITVGNLVPLAGRRLQIVASQVDTDAPALGAAVAALDAALVNRA